MIIFQTAYGNAVPNYLDLCLALTPTIRYVHPTGYLQYKAVVTNKQAACKGLKSDTV